MSIALRQNMEIFRSILASRTSICNNIAKNYLRCNLAQRRFCSANLTETTKHQDTPAAQVLPQKDKLYSRLEIEIKGSEPAVLKSYSWFATTAAGHLGIEIGNCWAQRKPHFNRFTLLKSVHIYKKHRVQYEIRTYYRFMHFHKLTESTLSTFLEYIERNIPEGVALKATKVELQKLPDHLKDIPADS